MPRQGDGSGDSGPYDAHEIVHGNTGDDTLQHTKHVAPAPKLEKGDALPGMNASGGVAAPLNDASEEYGATARRHERQEEDGSTSHSSGTKSSSSTGTGSSNNARSGQQTSSSSQSTSHKASHDKHGGSYGGSHGKHGEHGEHDLDQVSREKAERYVNLDEEDVEHAASQKHDVSSAQRSSQRAPKDVGNKEDIEQIHGKASSGTGNARGEDQQHTQKSQQGQQSKSGGSGDHHGGKSGGGQNEGGNEYEQEVRHKAEKFVNLDDEN